MKHLIQQRSELLKQAEAIRKNLYAVEKELNVERIIDDPSIIASLDNAYKLYRKGNFGAIRKHAQKIIQNLDSDRFYELVTYPDALESIRKEAQDGFDVYKLPFGGLSCPYGLPVVIGAPPKNRKTTFALNLVYQNIQDGIPSVFCTLELTPLHVVRRLLQIRVRDIDGESISFDAVAKYVSDKPQHIKWLEKALDLCAVLETNKYNASKLVNVLDRILLNRSAKVVYIDYFQRMRPDLDSQNDTRVGYMQTSRFLTDKCKDMNAVFVVLSQLNQAGEYKETGALTEDAGLALTLEASRHYVNLKVKASRFSGLTEIKLPIDEITGAVI